MFGKLVLLWDYILEHFNILVIQTRNTELDKITCSWNYYNVYF